jgi:plastocyanin
VAAYYVLGIAFVVWALVMTALGLTREGFPPSPSSGRAMIALSATIAVGALVALLLTTDREHPREEAKAEAAEKKAEAREGGAPAQAPEGGAAPAPAKGGGNVQVAEKEYSIALAGGTDLEPGSYKFAVSNVGKIQHDLAVENGGEKKTPLIDPGKKTTLAVDLKPGKYKLYCTVPGHEQLGMKAEVTVK